MVTAKNAAITTISSRPINRRRTVLSTPVPPYSCRSSSGDPYRRRGAPDREAEEEVQQGDRDDRGPHRAPDSDADTSRATAGPVTEVAVRHDDHDAEDQDLKERPQHVLRWQEQV